jgi:hypothetical protein
VECFSFINATTNNNAVMKFNLLQIFKDICGNSNYNNNRKYITISRFIKAYHKYIYNHSGLTLQTKKFFSMLFTSVLNVNDNKCIIGFETNQMLYSSQCYQSDKELTQLKLYSLNNEITGIELKYNNLYEALLYNIKYKHLF